MLMADLIPTVDRLARSHEENSKMIGMLSASQDKMLKAIEGLVQTQDSMLHVIGGLSDSQNKMNLEMSESRLLNMKLAKAIEKIVVNIDKLES